MDNVFIDEYFIQRKLIDKRQRQDYLLKAQIQLLPHTKEEERKKFFKNLEGADLTSDSRGSLIKKEVKTDFSAIEQAKQKLNM